MLINFDIKRDKNVYKKSPPIKALKILKTKYLYMYNYYVIETRSCVIIDNLASSLHVLSNISDIYNKVDFPLRFFV